MIGHKWDYYLGISICISLISILATLFINYRIAKEYLRVDGETQALFGIKELYQFGYQYYIVFLGLISFLLMILSKKELNQRGKRIAGIFFSLFAIAIIFLRVWRLYV